MKSTREQKPHGLRQPGVGIDFQLFDGGEPGGVLRLALRVHRDRADGQRQQSADGGNVRALRDLGVVLEALNFGRRLENRDDALADGLIFPLHAVTS
jgi:hypothetical protein